MHWQEILWKLRYNKNVTGTYNNLSYYWQARVSSLCGQWTQAV